MKKDLITLNFRDSNSKMEFEIISFKDFYNQPDIFRETPHIVNFYIILFITEGSGKHEINFKTYSYQKNDVLFINKEQLHCWKEYKNTKGFFLLFTETFLRQNQANFKDLSYSFPFNNYLYEPLISLNTSLSLSLQKLFSFIYEEYQSNENKQKKEILQSLLYVFFLKIRNNEIQEKTIGNSAQKKLFISFQKLMDQKLAESRNINDYSKWLNVSFKELNEVCKLFTNLTSKKFLNQVILLKAKQHLINNEKNINEIAYSLGFNEPTNFTKFFKKQSQQTPKEFQNTIFAKK
ncbi:AraC family transcriptional regulator [Aureivirga marina]|uniref:AraC family transcriptional regulator n=1 Tax=Aureivirga marina TaxID=1182451 RepID=UPI0018C8FACC|nr:helix-turn-helix domain-containing protein [Aureivirga marina]